MAKWEAGQSGNPTGKNGEKPFRDQILKLCRQENYVRLHKAAGALLDAASEGEPWAVQMLADRTDGKAVQAVSNEGEPFIIEIIKRIIVDPVEVLPAPLRTLSGPPK